MRRKRCFQKQCIGGITIFQAAQLTKIGSRCRCMWTMLTRADGSAKDCGVKKVSEKFSKQKIGEKSVKICKSSEKALDG